MKKISLVILMCISCLLQSMAQSTEEVPYFLKNYKSLYKKSPRAATMKWFEDARYGLFVHWGPAMYYKAGDWVLYDRKIPMKEYMDQAMKFTGEKWNADTIVDLAIRSEMKYITYVVKHHDGFAQYDTKAGTFSSMHAASKRDFLKELSVACKKNNIGLFVYFSLGIDWTHPFYLTSNYYSAARPHYTTAQPEIRFKGKEDFVHYWNYVKTQIYELCTNYGDLAGLWFDPIGGAYTNPDLFDVASIYAMIRKLQPHALISYKTGFNGEEDYISCEHEIKSITNLMRSVQGEKTAQAAEAAWQKNRTKLAELNTTMQNTLWGYNEKAKHKSAADIMALLKNAADNNGNLLLNIGPYPDGSIVPADKAALLEAGEIIRKQGLPKQDKLNYMKLRSNTKVQGRDTETAQ